ncbi:MAG: 23S rRNA (guanosine(2251)-2'-O)-methyltransferase RlmB [Oscillospiraceae bacterium]|jgi:23S rRNA (guanosine2251-2'-O)-methyltransferase|nr:23S rRNA (guanosine(2251)-2'-O)-methyltransferase RlmB [Oscillospiraceae bacterium]
MEDVLFGVQAVREALRAGRAVDSVLLAGGGALGGIRSLCRDKRIPIKDSDSRKLDLLSDGGNHQGVVALIAAHTYASLDDLFARARERGEAPFFVLLDGLEDPHNLGAIARTAEAAGAHGLILPERRSVGLTATVAKVAAGALEYLPVARVGNLAACMEELQKRGVWLYGADMGGSAYDGVDYAGGVGLVIGAEGRGLGTLVKNRCDFVVSLPMRGQIQSLNASVAAGILLYEIAKHRVHSTPESGGVQS